MPPQVSESKRAKALAALKLALAAIKKKKAAKTKTSAGKRPIKTSMWSLDGQTKRLKPAVNIKSVLTITQLYMRGPKSRALTALRDNVTIISLKRVKDNPNKLVSVSRTNDTTTGRKPRIRKFNHVIIKLEGEEKPFYKSRALVSCNCSDFTYTFEWVLKERGNSQIVHSNGDSPDSRNPRYVTGSCKHLLTLYKHIIDRKL
jgi:hypothetical protein